MKLKLYSILIGCLIISTASLNAQDNVIKINVLSPLIKTINVQYERVINTSGSLQIGFFTPGMIQLEIIGLTPMRLSLMDLV